MNRSGITRKTRLRPISEKRQANPTPAPTRRAWINRTTPKQRKRKPAATAAAKFAREFHSVERVEWVKRRPCRGCWSLNYAVENHHIETDGMSRRADYTKIIPLCGPCHREWHDHGRATFEANHKMDAEREAARLEAQWQTYLSRHPKCS